jgi:hypothetical protein
LTAWNTNPIWVARNRARGDHRDRQRGQDGLADLARSRVPGQPDGERLRLAGQATGLRLEPLPGGLPGGDRGPHRRQELEAVVRDETDHPQPGARGGAQPVAQPQPVGPERGVGQRRIRVTRAGLVTRHHLSRGARPPRQVTDQGGVHRTVRSGQRQRQHAERTHGSDTGDPAQPAQVGQRQLAALDGAQAVRRQAQQAG